MIYEETASISFSLPPCSGSAPPPGVDGCPVGNVENNEQHGKHAEKYQVRPGESGNTKVIYGTSVTNTFVKTSIQAGKRKCCLLCFKDL